MNGIWGSIIIPTLGNPIVLQYLDEENLKKTGVEIIVVVDRFWKNPPRVLNIGAAVARGNVFCFVEDDAGLEQEGLLELMRNIKESDQRSFYWITEPHILIVKSKLFFEVGGYDERFGAYGNYDVEMRERLKNFGAIHLDFPVELVKPKHLREKKWNRWRFYRMQKQLSIAYFEYKTFPRWRVLWRKNPIELARRCFWIIQWVLLYRWKKRSIYY